MTGERRSALLERGGARGLESGVEEGMV